MASLEAFETPLESSAEAALTSTGPSQQSGDDKQTFQDASDDYIECRICGDICKPAFDRPNNNQRQRANKKKSGRGTHNSRARKIPIAKICGVCDQSRIKTQGRFKMCPSPACNYAVEEPSESPEPAVCHECFTKFCYICMEIWTDDESEWERHDRCAELLVCPRDGEIENYFDMGLGAMLEASTHIHVDPHTATIVAQVKKNLLAKAVFEKMQEDGSSTASGAEGVTPSLAGHHSIALPKNASLETVHDWAKKMKEIDELNMDAFVKEVNAYTKLHNEQITFSDTPNLQATTSSSCPDISTGSTISSGQFLKGAPMSDWDKYYKEQMKIMEQNVQKSQKTSGKPNLSGEEDVPASWGELPKEGKIRYVPVNGNYVAFPASAAKGKGNTGVIITSTNPQSIYSTHASKSYLQSGQFALIDSSQYEIDGRDESAFGGTATANPRMSGGPLPSKFKLMGDVSGKSKKGTALFEQSRLKSKLPLPRKEQDHAYGGVHVKDTLPLSPSFSQDQGPHTASQLGLNVDDLVIQCTPEDFMGPIKDPGPNASWETKVLYNKARINQLKYDDEAIEKYEKQKKELMSKLQREPAIPGRLQKKQAVQPSQENEMPTLTLSELKEKRDGEEEAGLASSIKRLEALQPHKEKQEEGQGTRQEESFF